MLLGLLLVMACRAPEPDEAEGLHVASAENMQGPFTNRLAGASSPYLAQHGHNPVDWYPWGPEALKAAQERQVPIFLSVGYAACHWCHVMEEESFEDPAVAAFLNQHFVPIKVDREERPDVDAVYMDAVVALNGSGGWPMSVWLTPEGEPFHGGTYFPPTARGGRPGFLELLTSIHEAWTDERTQVASRADALTAELRRRATTTATPLPEQALEPFVRATVDAWDPNTRGWGARKFPMVPRQQALLDAAVLTDDADARAVVAATLDAMDRGGIHDQLGGGFHRYTVDARWQVPHFEKMLVDNGQLIGLYATASVALDTPRFADVARDTARWLHRDLYDAGTGLFHSSLDADTEGQEGATYLWTPEQFRDVLADDANAVMTTYAVTPEGNHEGRTVLTRPAGPPPNAAYREALLTARSARAQPRVDTKEVVAYNALAIEGLARAGRLLDEPAWVVQAAAAMTTLLAARHDAGHLPRTVGGDPAAGVLDDYAFTVVALVELHQATGDARWLREAQSVWQVMDGTFWDAEQSLWRHSADEGLVVQRVDAADGAEPSGVARAVRATALLRAMGSSGVPAERLEQALAGSAPWLARSPASVPSIAVSHALAQRPAMTAVVVGPDVASTEPLRRVFHEAWRPQATLVVSTEAEPLVGFTITEGKTAAVDAPRAFVCYDGTCQQPVSDPDLFRAQLASGETP